MTQSPDCNCIVGRAHILHEKTCASLKSAAPQTREISPDKPELSGPSAPAAATTIICPQCWQSRSAARDRDAAQDRLAAAEKLIAEMSTIGIELADERIPYLEHKLAVSERELQDMREQNGSNIAWANSEMELREKAEREIERLKYETSRC